MIGLLYLILCFGVGWAICSFAFPGLALLTQKDYLKRTISISPYFILVPSWYVTGTLALTWPVYLMAYLFRHAEEPLYYANLIVMPVAVVAFALMLYYRLVRNKDKQITLLCAEKKTRLLEYLLLAAVVALAMILMWKTFYIRDNSVHVGYTVFSDFSPHLGMIRSFSHANNFPTAYSHYGGEDIKYHFMFQFLAGNLEYLGLRLDYAFNIPSIISLVSAFIMLYILAVKITGKLSVGILSCLFFAFRSAKTLFTYLSNIPKGTSIWKALADNSDFISDTPNEDWGLWNLNVYCNQRHLAFGLTVFFLVLIIFIPHLYEMFEALKQLHFNKSSQKRKNYHQGISGKVRENIRVLFFTKEAWGIADPRRAIATGVLLGSLSFFHGSALVGCLLVLFVIAILSARRLEFLITAVITMLMSIAQTSFFIEGSAVSTKYLFGFIAENKTIFGVASYLERLLGILPFVLLAAFCLEKGVGKYLMLAFTAPLIFAFTISMTLDVTVNHKYIMMSCILLGIFAASLIVRIFEKKEFLTGMVGVLLVIMLTSTGIYDFTTILRKNTLAVVLDLDDPLTEWIDENSNSQDLFLTHPYALNQVVLGGAMLYEGHSYYPWSAGYDTTFRMDQLVDMYEADTPEQLMELAKKNNIRFIVIDRDNRTSDYYELNEENIRATYQCVYTQGEGIGETSIFDTGLPLQ